MSRINPDMSNSFDTPDPAVDPNTSGLIPQGHAVLTLPVEDRRPESKIVLPDTVKERAQMVQDKVTVVAIGGACWIDEPSPRARVGDVVYIPYMAGRMVKGPSDGILYRVINDKDVILVTKR